MNINQQRQLHSQGIIRMARFHAYNPLPSATDPTQDIPVKNIQLGLNGEPLNVRKMPMGNGVPIDQLSAIDRRNTDKFDALGELQATQKSTTNIINKLKQQENEQK